MDDRMKRRLIGATVVVALLVIFLPMLVEKEKLPTPPAARTPIPPKPAVDDSTRPQLLPDPAAPLAPAVPPKPAEVANAGRLQVPAELPQPATQKEPLLRTEPPPVSAGAPPAPAPLASAPPPAAPARPATPAAPPSPPPAAAPPTPASGGGSWVVQVAAYTETAKAEALAARLNSKGFKTFVEPTLVNGKEYFRVRIGPEGDRNHMAQIAEQVGKDFKVDAQVKRYP